MIEIVGDLLVQHQTRSQVLETLLPAAVTLGGRTGAVLSGLSLLLLAGGIARGFYQVDEPKQGITFQFAPGRDVLASHGEQLHAVSGRWLQSRHSPELRYSLGTVSALADPDIVVGLAFAADGRLEAFVSWLPVPVKNAWTLDLMRRRPESKYGVMGALIVRSIEEARGRGIAELSLGVAPRVIASRDVPRGIDRALRAMYWGLDRFQRSRTLRRFPR